MENKDNRVKKVCGELGITQKELAEILGLSSTTLTNWATDKVEIPAWAIKCFELLIIEKKFNQLKEIIKDQL